jgi:hypothetical protein
MPIWPISGSDRRAREPVDDQPGVTGGRFVSSYGRRVAMTDNSIVLGLLVAGLLGPTVGVLIAGLLGPTVAVAEPAQPDSPFRFEIERRGNPRRGLAVEGYLYSDLPWRITNVRLRVESVDSNGAVTAESHGWLLGDVAPGDRAYFYLPISSPAPTYRPAVESFDRVSGSPARVEAP